jgi:hypothetical protein
MLGSIVLVISCGLAIALAPTDPAAVLQRLFASLDSATESLPRTIAERIAGEAGVLVIEAGLPKDTTALTAGALHCEVEGPELKLVSTQLYVESDGVPGYRSGGDRSESAWVTNYGEATHRDHVGASFGYEGGSAGPPHRFLHVTWTLADGGRIERTLGPAVPPEPGPDEAEGSPWQDLLIQWHTGTRLCWRRRSDALELRLHTLASPLCSEPVSLGTASVAVADTTLAFEPEAEARIARVPVQSLVRSPSELSRGLRVQVRLERRAEGAGTVIDVSCDLRRPE